MKELTIPFAIIVIIIFIKILDGGAKEKKEMTTSL